MYSSETTRAVCCYCAYVHGVVFNASVSNKFVSNKDPPPGFRDMTLRNPAQKENSDVMASVISKVSIHQNNKGGSLF